MTALKGARLAADYDDAGSRERWRSGRDGVEHRALDNNDVAKLTAADGVAPEVADRESGSDLGRLAAIVQSSEDAIVIKTLRGTITSWNPGAERLYGWTADEMIGKPIGMLIPDERAGEEWQILGHVFSQRTIEQYETQRLRKDGSIVDVSLMVSPVYDRAGKVVAASTIARDIGARKRTAEELRRAHAAAEAARGDAERAQREAERASEQNALLAAIVRGTDDAILTKTREGIITSWNPGAAALYGWSSEEIVGKPVSLLLPPERVAEELDIVSHVFSGQSIEHYETQRLCKNGEVIDVSLTLSPVYDSQGNVVAVSSIARDVGARKRAEERLRRARADAQAAKEEAERANLAKSEFLSRMSHELRTPLNVVLGFGQLLEMSDVDESQRQYVGHIMKAGKHLLDLINEVLDIARIEAGGMSLSVEPVNAAPMIGEVVELMAPLAGQRDVSLVNKAEGAGWVVADAQRLKQVLLNLLSNAIKYNRAGGSVHVGASPTADVLRIEVADTGVGIPEDRLADLFTPFQRLGAERTNVEGTGLGLALSKGLIEGMGGRLAVESRPGQGSTFRIDLETAQGNGSNERDSGVWTAPGVPRAESRPTVLYIEDNLANVQLLEEVFARRPELRLLPAMQGGLGLELAGEHEPALILLDLDLPDMHGREVLARLRRNPVTADTPVVILSADATPAGQAELLEAGAVDYLSKPLNVKRFMRMLDTYALPHPAP